MTWILKGVTLNGSTDFTKRTREVMNRHMQIVPLPGVALNLLGHETALLGAITAAIYGILNMNIVEKNYTDTRRNET